MRKGVRRAGSWTIAAFAALISVSAVAHAQTAPKWEVYFSPNGGCTDAIVRAIHSAQQTILVQAYELTSIPIADALSGAKRRGIDVKVIIDPKLGRHPSRALAEVIGAGIPVTVDVAHRMAHNKVMVIDSSTVITGSFNFTAAAEYDHAENLLVIHDTALAARYADNWKLHASHSTPYHLPR
jgi:phosphatidylserine/phosphatidylglycerophosphate/cardiolipin synthase-like enzyme